jgi:hypothetical protein
MQLAIELVDLSVVLWDTLKGDRLVVVLEEWSVAMLAGEWEASSVAL